MLTFFVFVRGFLIISLETYALMVYLLNLN